MNDLRQGTIERLLGRFNLRFPALFAIFAGLTLLDILVPDFVPFVDEIGLALLTLILGMWRRRNTPPAGTASNPSPPGGPA